MAWLEIEVQAGASVGGYSLFVDGMPVTTGLGHRGRVRCEGRCGDGSTHALMYSFSGAPGAPLAITIRCSARIVFGPRVEIIGAAGPPWRAGRELFAI